MSRRSSLLTQIQNKPVRTSQTKKWNNLSIDQELNVPVCQRQIQYLPYRFSRQASIINSY